MAAHRLSRKAAALPAALLQAADDVLRRRVVAEGASLGKLLAVTIGFSMAYGAVMGSYSGLEAGRHWQLVYSAVKAPLLLLITLVVGLPSYYVIGALLGVGRDFVPAVRAMFAAQAGLAVVLAALAPLTAFWYVCSMDYGSATLFNLGMFGIASLSAHYLLRGHFAVLIARRPAHRIMLGVWLTTTAFVGVQMAWVLRPFIGDPHKPVQFFREDSWGNAYLVTARLILDAISL